MIVYERDTRGGIERDGNHPGATRYPLVVLVVRWGNVISPAASAITPLARVLDPGGEAGDYRAGAVSLPVNCSGEEDGACCDRLSSGDSLYFNNSLVYLYSIRVKNMVKYLHG